MKNLIKDPMIRNSTILLSIGVFLFLVTKVVATGGIDEPFRPGDTSNPDCAMDDDNCTVFLGQDLYKENPVADGGNTTSGNDSVAIGKYNTASGIGSIAIGAGDGVDTFGGNASEEYSVSIGSNSLASGYGAVSILGEDAGGDKSVAIGEGTVAKSFREIVLGSYPDIASYTPSADSWSSSDRIFTIGNGATSGSRSDAMVVLKNGQVNFGDVKINGNKSPFDLSSVSSFMILPQGDTGSAGNALSGALRFNKSTGLLEYGDNTPEWIPIEKNSLDLYSESYTAGTKPSSNGNGAVAIGGVSIAANPRSIAIGNGVVSGYQTVSEWYSIPDGVMPVVVGQFNKLIADNDDPVAQFTVGVGSGSGSRTNGLIVYKSPSKGGAVGIGDFTASELPIDDGLEFATKAGGKIIAGVWSDASDRSLKDNIEDLDYGLDEILEIEPKSFNYKLTPDKRSIGFVAQDVKEIIPEIVTGNEGSMGISYGHLVAVLVNAVKELDARVRELEGEPSYESQRSSGGGGGGSSDSGDINNNKGEELQKEDSSQEKGDSGKTDGKDTGDIGAGSQASVLTSIGANVGLNTVLLSVSILMFLINITMMIYRRERN
ncbi:MAG: tail fiber domain-containing protein [Bacteroidetes bacterium]|nr:tail fiber domain-containing protein [Bacteroidota bacterium]